MSWRCLGRPLSLTLPLAQPAHPSQAISQLRAPLRSSKPGTTIPRLGLGTWQAASEHVEEAVFVALQSGIRHVDTASEYGVEKQVGNAIKRAMKTTGIQRDDIQVTTKARLSARCIRCYPRLIRRRLTRFAALEYRPLAGGGGLPQVAF